MGTLSLDAVLKGTFFFFKGDVSSDKNIEASRSSELGEFLLFVEPFKTHE